MNGEILRGQNDMGERRERLPGEVYFVEAERDDTVLIGMDVEVIKNGDDTMVRWFDTVKERRMGAARTVEDAGVFAFERLESEGGGAYRFEPMSLEIYEARVKDKVWGGREFEDLEGLAGEFLKTKDNQY